MRQADSHANASAHSKAGRKEDSFTSDSLGVEFEAVTAASSFGASLRVTRTQQSVSYVYRCQGEHVHLAHAYNKSSAVFSQPEHVDVGVRIDESEGLSERVLNRLPEREGVGAGREDGEADVAVG